MNWTVAVESHVDSSFFWGYLVTQIPGGFIASKFPANKIFGLSIVSSATLHLFVPFAMTLMHGHVVICVRVLQGLFEVRNPSNQPTNQLTKFDFATDQSRGLRLRDVAKMGRVRFCFMIKQICEMETCPKPSKGWGSYQGKGKITKAFILMRFLCVKDWGVCHFSLTRKGKKDTLSKGCLLIRFRQ